MKLKNGGMLYKESYNSKTKKYDLIDVTNEAYAYLYENVEIENVTVRDIYSLIAKHSPIQQILTRNYIKEFLEHIATNPKKENKEVINSDAEIEYIEIYRNGYYDSELNRLDFDNIPSIHGCSHILKEDYEEHPAGQRINWSLSFTPIANILDLPIKINTLVHCQQDNYLSAYDFTTKIKFERKSYTLFDILNAITWEISFHGSPESTQEAGENLKNMVDELQEDIANMDNDEEGEDEQSEFSSIDDILPQDELIKGFSFIEENINKKKLNKLMRYLPNKVDVALFFGLIFPKRVMVKEIYAGLTAYEYRHKMSQADEDLLLSKEMKDIIVKKQAIRNSEITIVEDTFFEILEELGASITIQELNDLEVF